MQSRILIKTPEGYAQSTEKKLRPFILGIKKKHKHEIYCSNADDQILWIVESDIKNHFRIQRNVKVFDKLISSMLSNKAVRKIAKLNKDQVQELDKMLFEQTKVTLLTDDETEEIKKEFKKI